MPGLYATPAETSYGVLFADRFESAEAIAENGGTPVGSPVFATEGVALDGVSDYLVHALVPRKLARTPAVSIVLEFTPGFALDDGLNHYLMDGPALQLYSVLKNAANGLQVFLGNTSVATIVYATVLPAWRVGLRNVLVVTSVSGDTSVWLNGTNLLLNGATAWTPTDTNTLYVGATNGGASLFAGTIHRLLIFRRQITDGDALAYSLGTIWRYDQDYVLHLPMDMVHHDPVNVRTLDVSGNGNHAFLGDGTPGATNPAKNTGIRGYSFDGAAQYMRVLASASLNKTNKFHFSFWMRNNKYANPATDDLLLVKWAGAFADCRWGFFVQAGADTFLAKWYSAVDLSQTLAVNGFTLDDRQRHMVTVTFNDGAYVVYRDAQIVASGTLPTDTALSDNALHDLYIGGGVAARYAQIALISDVTVGGFLSPLQVLDKYVREQRWINAL